MAIMTRCCCCDVRVGSIVVSIWVLIASAASLIQSARAWAAVDAYEPDTSLTTAWGVIIAVNSLLLLAGVCLLFGVIKDKKELLIPYIAVESLYVVGYFVLEVAVIVLLANGNYVNFDFFDVDFSNTGVDPNGVVRYIMIALAVAIPLYILLDLMCLLCVISQYQELRDGRGQRFVPATTLIIQNQGYTTGFAPPTYDPTPAPQQQYYKC